MITNTLLRNRLRRSNGLRSVSEINKFSFTRRSERSPGFNELGDNRLLVGNYRYGGLRDPEKPDFDRVARGILEFKLYLEDGNLEHLVDVRNMALLEFEEGAHPKRHFKATDDTIHCRVKRS